MNDLNQCNILDAPPPKKIKLLTMWLKILVVQHQYIKCPSPQEKILKNSRLVHKESQK